MKKIVLGAGCFWCVEAIYQQVKGVEKVISGYAGGGTDRKPSYWGLHTGKSQHAEVIQVTYDESVVSLETLLEIFFSVHDPTTKDRQGHDIGPGYRSIILCAKSELHIAEKAKQKAQESWKNPIVTEIHVLDTFYPAEKHHQDFYARNQNSGYCQVIINPKLAEFRQKFASLIKES